MFLTKFFVLGKFYRHQELPQRLMIFLEFFLELMMIMMFLTGAGVLDGIMDGLHMP